MFYFSGRCAQCIEVKYNIFVMDVQQRGNDLDIPMVHQENWKSSYRVSPICFSRKCMIIIQKEKHKEMLCITCNSEDVLLLMVPHIYMCLYTNRIIFLSIVEVMQAIPHFMMYCMLNPFSISGHECSVWLHSLSLLWNCTVLYWYGKANYLF